MNQQSHGRALRPTEAARSIDYENRQRQARELLGLVQPKPLADVVARVKAGKEARRRTA